MFSLPTESAPQQARSLTLQAFEQLRADVIGGVLRPGERLRVQALSQRYATGSTAIREALSRLVTDGLVQFEAQRGFLVAHVSRAELIDLTQTRIDLETLAITRAVERADPASEAIIVGKLHLLSRSAPPTTPDAAQAWGGAHRAFHEALLGGCGSPWLLRLCRLLYDKSERYRHLANIRVAMNPGQRGGDDHKELADAVLARDGSSACRILSTHYRKTTEIILQAEGTAALFGTGSAAESRSANTRSPAPLQSTLSPE
jgi:DNA-binding GntR family transcriptional regulator